MRTVPTLHVTDLHMVFDTVSGPIHVLQGIDLNVNPGEVVGLVGESGSGKSTLAYACLGHMSANARVTAGDIQFEGASLVVAPTNQLAALRGRHIAMVYQDPNTSLNPTLPIGVQIAEVLQHHLHVTQKEARSRSITLLKSVNLRDAAGSMQKYPHQFSGGEKQRILIAMAFACKPSLLLLDEPTTALDPTTAAGVLDLIRDLQRETQVATLYITHNLGTVAEISQQLNVIYAGKIVETGPTQHVLRQPQHPYTRMLLASIPGIRRSRGDSRLAVFSGRPVDLHAPPTGCIFQDRCPFVAEPCRSDPISLQGSDHKVACIRSSEIADQNLPRAGSLPHADQDHNTAQVLLSIEKLSVDYRKRGGWPSRSSQAGRVIRAVRDVALHLRQGETLALVGESGSGKSSLARALVGLETAAGTIHVVGKSYTLPSRLGTGYRRKIQIIFQNPDQSLNPRQTIESIVERPLILSGVPRKMRRQRTMELLEQVRLPLTFANRYPHQLSGGEKQRVAIARAFATAPDVVICDEITSALDVSVQASIVNLLADLQALHGTSYIFISHDLNLVRRIAIRVAVMYLGEIVETGSTEALFHPPYHPYTEALLSAVPSLGAQSNRAKIRLEGDPPSPTELPLGCPFASRCPRKLGVVCESTKPPIIEISAEHRLNCHIPADELRRLPPAFPGLDVENLQLGPSDPHE